MPDVVGIEEGHDIRAAIGLDPVERGVARGARAGIGLYQERERGAVRDLRRRRQGGAVIHHVDMQVQPARKLLRAHAVERAGRMPGSRW
jgi:hypothetical protein